MIEKRIGQFITLRDPNEMSQDEIDKTYTPHPPYSIPERLEILIPQLTRDGMNEYLMTYNLDFQEVEGKEIEELRKIISELKEQGL